VSRLFIGSKTGVGPVVKVMQDAGDDPLTTPNTDYHKFRFNSEVQQIAYSYGRSDWSFSGTYWWSACPNAAWPSPNPDLVYGSFVFAPAGSNSSNFVEAVMATHLTTSTYRRFAIAYALDRMTDLSIRTILFRAFDRSDWVSSWHCERREYQDGGDWRYVSYSLNDVPTTTRPIYKGTLVDLSPGRTLRAYDPFASPDTGPYYPAWLHSIASRPEGAPVQSNEFPLASIQVYGTAKAAKDYTEDRIVFTELPIEDNAYPSTVGAFAADKLIVRIAPDEVRIAKPGFDVATATRDQLLLSSDKVPMKVVATGSFTLAASGTLSIPVAVPISPRCVVEAQVNVTGQTLLLPPYPDNNVDEIKLEHRIVSGAIEFRNQSTVSLDCRFFVLADDINLATSGSAKVIEVVADSHVLIRRPNSAGTVDRDVLLDTRAAFLPIVAQGWVAAADITEASDVARYGSHKYVVSFANGGFHPLVIARAKYEINEAPGTYVWTDFFAKNVDDLNTFSSSSFVAKVNETSVVFYVDRDGTRDEDRYRDEAIIRQTTLSQLTLIGFRHYVFAVPLTL